VVGAVVSAAVMLSGALARASVVAGVRALLRAKPWLMSRVSAVGLEP